MTEKAKDEVDPQTRVSNARAEIEAALHRHRVRMQVWCQASATQDDPSLCIVRSGYTLLPLADE